LAETVAAWWDSYPDVQIEERAVPRPASATLVDASKTAALVGALGRGGLAGLLGSTSQQLLHHADCPVAVIRS
jgi:nucleotide-binding universal stress UspA family protein